MIKVISQFVPKEFTLCVSGGVDSIAAAHWLKYNFRRKFTVLHFNHNVQDINDEMEQKVYEFILKYLIQDCGGKMIIRDESSTPAFKDTSEAGLREWRLYKMRGIGGNFVTAHHLDDAVENYLMNCFHGTPEHKPISEFTQFKGFSIYHPFLLTTKQDFIDYAIEHDLMKYVVEDPTNKETTQKRNWIRNVIVPELKDRQLGLNTIVRKKFYNNLQGSMYNTY